MDSMDLVTTSIPKTCHPASLEHSGQPELRNSPRDANSDAIREPGSIVRGQWKVSLSRAVSGTSTSQISQSTAQSADLNRKRLEGHEYRKEREMIAHRVVSVFRLISQIQL